MEKWYGDDRSKSCIGFLEKIHELSVQYGIQLELSNYDNNNGIVVTRRGSKNSLSPEIYKEFLMSCAELIDEDEPKE